MADLTKFLLIENIVMVNSTIKNTSVFLGILLFLAGCGGSSGESTKLGDSGPSDPVPNVELNSNSTSINYNGSVTLNWSTTAVSQCIASGDWSGNKGTSGTETFNFLTADSTYTLTCTGEDGNISDTVNISVPENEFPTVSLIATPAFVSPNGSSTLSWNSTGTDSCTASGDWSGSKAVSGTQIISNLTVDSTYNLSCSGNGENVNTSVNVVIATAPAPTIDLTANPEIIAYNGSTTLSWNSSNADSCTATGDWSGNKASSGSQNISALTANSNFGLTCTGPGGVTNDSVSITVGSAPRPTVNLSASPSSVSFDGSTTLSWNTSNADSCTASGDWSGSKSTSGSQTITSLTSNSSFTLSCSGAGGNRNDTVNVTVAAAPTPTINLSASPTSVSYDGFTTLSWNVSNANSCTASGDWSGSKATSGSQVINSLTTDSQFNLSCSGDGGSANDSVNVTVVLNNNGTALLSWTPPTENSDGSPLNDLAGYKVHYGTSPGTYANTVTINNAGLTSFLIDNLSSATWYFAMTSYTDQGLESSYSAEMSKTIN